MSEQPRCHNCGKLVTTKALCDRCAGKPVWPHGSSGLWYKDGHWTSVDPVADVPEGERV